ncbi:MAG: hypothetical protein ABIG96_04765 [Candidatus Micrarchaeota archaeon]
MAKKSRIGRKRPFSEEAKEAAIRIKAKFGGRKKRDRFEREIRQAAERLAGISDRAFPPRRKRKIEYSAAIIANLVLYYVINNLVFWRIPFIDTPFVDVVWAFNLSILALLVVYSCLILYDPAWFRNVGEIITNLFGLNVINALLAVFPFTFPSETMSQIFRFCLKFSLFVVVLVVIFRVIWLMLFLVREEKK